MPDPAALRRLVGLAEKADRFSDSPWESRDGSVYDNCGPVVVTNKNIRGAQAKAIAAFIAACDPQTIIALVKLAEAGAATGAGATPTCGAETPMRPTVVEGDQPAPALDAERRVIDMERARRWLDGVTEWDPGAPSGRDEDNYNTIVASLAAEFAKVRASGTRP